MFQNTSFVTVNEGLLIARLALREAKTMQEAKRIADVATAAEIYAQRQKLGEEAIGYAHSIKIEALRRLGEMLQETERADGGDAQRTRLRKGTESPLTLDDFGLDKKTSHIAQQLADLPQEQFEQVREGTSTMTKAIREVVHA